MCWAFQSAARSRKLAKIVKPHRVHGQGFVRQRHDQTIIRLRRDIKTLRQCAALDNQGMVAGGLEGLVDAAKQGLSAMLYFGNLAMKRLRCAHDIAAKGLPDRLHAEADAENRDPVAQGLDHIKAYSCLGGGARPR